MSLLNVILTKINPLILCFAFKNLYFYDQIEIKKSSLDSFCNYSETLISASEYNNLDPFLLASLIYQETRWTTNLKSHKGACGLTQVIPFYVGQTCDYLINSPEFAIEAGAYVLNIYNHYSKFNIEKALQCYASGYKCNHPSYSNNIIQNAYLLETSYFELENELNE